MEETAQHPDDFAADFDSALARLQALIEEECERVAEWPLAVAAAVRAALDFAASDVAAATTLTGRALAQGPYGTARYRQLTADLAERLRAGRAERSDGGSELPEITERALAGGLLALVAQRLDEGREAELPATAPEVIQFVLTPYLGAEEARRLAAGGADAREPR